MTVRWVENARGGGTPHDRVPSAQAAHARANASAGRPAETARPATDERDRR
ncbi:hypothetical protein [Amycolatopsis balhimycina]|uniref:hypothetical protein n=1 Tax=Amycolatopsis balhimycina TaxID=208443 RepID=UPI000378486B|nr:hypothetical protein [Amycolatopsis balhimycina]